MKYLKKIFEKDLYSQVDEAELQDFCETYLAYLLDDTSFKIEVIDTERSGAKSAWDSYIIWLGKTLVDRRIQPFHWNDIKDYYIPFVTILSREYDLNDIDLDQKGSSIIINFMSGNQLFLKADEIEDWGGRLVKRPDYWTGDDIKEIGIVVKRTIKQKTNEGIKKSLFAASLGLGLMGNPQITKGSNITPISQTQTQKVLARVNFESYQPISNPDLDLVHGALGSNRLQDDFEKRVEDELKNQVNNGNKPDVANIQVRTYVQGDKIITKASCDIVQSVDGIAYTHFTTRGSIGSNYVQRHDNQINGLVSRLENHYGGIAKQVGNTIEISFKLNGNVISYKQSFFVSSDGNINNNQITATDINNLRDKLNFETRDIYVDISSISVDMKNYKVSYKTGDVEIYKMSLLFDDSGNLDNRLKMIKSKNPTFKEVKRGKEGNLDWVISVITKQVSEKMRYLKTFESVDLESDLRDFCETYLAYLLDGDFELSVIWNGHGYLGREEDDYNINLCKLNWDLGWGKATDFTWNDVKDSYIPFLHMLDKQYEIMDEGEASRNAGQWDVPCICLYNGSQNFCVSIKDVLSGEPLPGRYDDVPLLEITLQVGMKNKLVE